VERIAEKEAACKQGEEAARAVLAQSEGPIMLMDEGGLSDTDFAFAVGWNSIAVSDENRRRWTEARTIIKEGK